jgi:hypothetical protein
MIFNKSNFIFVISLAIISFSVNFYYASLGVLPIDTFAFFDTGFRLTVGDLPFVDYWTISGPFIDLLQAFYFSILGVSWNSYILNGSIINLIITLISYNFFKKTGLSLQFSFFYAICVAFLANPSMGTPFPDHYSTFFSLFAIMSFLSALKYEKDIYWFLIPIFLFIAFLCKQTPAAYIIFLFIINFSLYSLIKKNFKFIKPVILGTLVSITLFLLLIWFYQIDLMNIIIQYVLYPRTIALNRITEWHLSFNKAVSTLKLIHLLLLPLILIFLKNILFQNNYIYKNEFFYNLNIIIFSILLILHQWITLNFIFIFFLIPYLCSMIQINLYNIKYRKIIISIILSFCLVGTIKYHSRFNQERKMLNLENLNLNNFYAGDKISTSLNGLKWVTRDYVLENRNDIDKILKIKSILKNEKKKIMFLSNYNFFSSILKKNLNSPNRWYGGDVAHPKKNNPYYKEYKIFNYDLILKKKIEIIYVDIVLGNYHLDMLSEIVEQFPSGCANIGKIEGVLVFYDISNCYQ